MSYNTWIHIGIKKKNYQTATFVSSGLTVPYNLPWQSGHGTGGPDHVCIYAHITDFKWDDYKCINNWYSICESS